MQRGGTHRGKKGRKGGGKETLISLLVVPNPRIQTNRKVTIEMPGGYGTPKRKGGNSFSRGKNVRFLHLTSRVAVPKGKRGRH